MPQIRVAAILPLYPPKSRVGAWLATHGLLRGLADRGHRVEVATFLRRRQASYTLDGIRVDPGEYAQQTARRADVVIAHLGSAGPDALQPLRFDAPTVRIVHGLPFDPRRLEGAALAVANSRFTAAEIRRSWRGPIVVARPPTDPREFRAIPGDRVTAINLSEPKGGDLFWAVAELLPDVAFLGVRGGYGRQILRQLPNVAIIGPHLPLMASQVYGRTKLLLVPSRAETWGMAAVEALASGIPVLARPLPALRESLGRAGNWCDSDDPAVWAAEISDLLGARRWAGAAHRSRRRSRELDPEAERQRFADAVEAIARGERP